MGREGGSEGRLGRLGRQGGGTSRGEQGARLKEERKGERVRDTEAEGEKSQKTEV